MFLGTYEPSLLAKGRTALPKKIRDNISGSSVILTIGFEKCIFGFDKKAWDEVVKPELEKPFFSDKEGRDMRRRMFVNAMEVQVDSQGRIILPDFMSPYAGIKDQITIIGAGDHFEIWDREEWSQYQKDLTK